MIKRSIMGLIGLGESLQYLRERHEGHPITHERGSELGLLFVNGTIEVCLRYLREYGLSVTLNATGELENFLSRMKSRETGATLSQEEAVELREIMASLEKTLRAEAKGMHSFFTTDKRIPMDRLTAKQESLFPEGLFSELPDIAKHDVREAGMCIAFERATAAAFHVLRATEAVLRELYCRAVKRKRVKSPNWGNITSDLASRRRKPSPTTMKNLDYIRENFRNPTNHPEYRYNVEEAQSLFNLCVDVMSRLIKDPLWKKP